LTYFIEYYDIGWNVHSARVEAASPEAAVETLLASKVCTRHEVITCYPFQGESK
jgi:hypothetical protein